MSAADAGEVFASRPYYDSYIHPSRDLLDGLGYEEIRDLKTKHGEPLEVYRVTTQS
jgi:hypothetical protein